MKNHHNPFFSLHAFSNGVAQLSLSILFLMGCHTVAAQQAPTRGVGIYPGAPEEFFGPQLVDGTSAGYRNLALGRMVSQSSSFDFNMTAQLLTDGIKNEKVKSKNEKLSKNEGALVFLEVTTPDGQLPQRQRESTIDGNEWTQSIVMGSDTWLQYAWHGMTVKADAVRLMGTVAYREKPTPSLAQKGMGYCIKVVVSQDGKRWQEVATAQADTLPGRRLRSMVHSDPNKNSGTDDLLPSRRLDVTLPFAQAQTFRFLRVELQMEGAAYWTFTEVPFTLAGRRLYNELLPSSGFTSAWMVLSDKDEWACVDLGAPAKIEDVRLHWIEKPKRFEVQTSDDGRFVRIFIPSTGKMQRAILSEVEVMGHGGIWAYPQPLPEGRGEGGGGFSLNGGDWRLQRASEVSASGSQIASKGFDTSQWTVATVPATVLMSYVNAGALPNPNYDDNLLTISESFFNSNFWYRREFRLPDEMKGQRVFLNFDGINWKADIWLNGQKVDRVEGAFMRGKTDITPYLNDDVNVLAVEIEKCANPGGAKLKNEQTTDFNGGRLGADNPTFHATVGWDWISSIRGRNIGIWDDVYLTASPTGLTLSDPMVSNKVHIPTYTDETNCDTLATIEPAVMVKNYADQPQTATLCGWIGDIKFEKEITLAAHEEQQVVFDPADYPQLCNQKMHLWWPNGYGEPYLYDAGFELTSQLSPLLSTDPQPPILGGTDSRPPLPSGGVGGGPLYYKTGIREVTYDEVDTRLQVFVNGMRFVPLGGNWGFSENNLCYRGREYDAAVRYHRDMNLNCIRNWVGQIGDREFYEACDRYGIMVWQDFWLANPADGPDPDDNAMFLKNARDYVLRIRQHPSIMLYCGRNEGYPPKTLDDGLRQIVRELTTPLPSREGQGGGSAGESPLYISSSADDGVSGHGPYWAIPAKEYFARQTGKLHTERGMPNIMTYEGLARTLRPEHLWPQNQYWGQHDFTQQGAQRGASFNQLISLGFGEPTSAQEFTTLAQWQNYDGYRAMYESTNVDRQGLLIWMSHPTWPSMVWQTYDYYLEPTAAFFGVKKACEPLHVQWNALTDSIEVVNRTDGDDKLMTVEATLYSMYGKELARDYGTLNIGSDATDAVMPVPWIQKPGLLKGDDVGFLRLRLTDAANDVLSENTYVCASDTGNYQALRQLPQAKVKVTEYQSNKVTEYQSDNVTLSPCYSVTLENSGAVPALMLRLNLVGTDGEQVLPVHYDDNYFHLMPGEKRTIRVQWNPRDARGGTPHIVVSGYNL